LRRFRTRLKTSLNRSKMSDIEKDFAVHEAVCAERYRVISDRLDTGKERMQRIEYILYVVIIAVLFGPGVAGEFLKKLLGI
jgi:hypothetical protein